MLYETLPYGFAQELDQKNAVRNRLRQRPGSFIEITRLLAQAALYQVATLTRDY